MSAYYNEIDPFAAQWLRELIKAGLIAPGDVDGRSIEDVTPNDLRGYSQCHFFAGIGGWSYALRLAGWPDDRPVWTGSCPCQPFSAAGKGKGFADARHLWPSWYWLIQQCRPAIVFGEQVASKATNVWFDLVQADLEAMGYAFGVVPFPAASLGAPHIRDRAYWMADSTSVRHASADGQSGKQKEERWLLQPSGDCGFGGLADSECGRHKRIEEQHTAGVQQQVDGQGKPRDATGARGASSCGMADAYEPGLQPWKRDDQTERYWHTVAAKSFDDRSGKTSQTNGFWRDADWLFCRDGKWRPVEPGSSPLAHGVPNRVGKLRGYGNAIVAPQAAEFIKTVMEAKS